MMDELQSLQEEVSNLADELACGSDGFLESEDILELKRDLAKKASRLKKQEQTLSIGIMGQVKAGKSSFLNALLFDGQQVLPEAATPKTANLTRILYGDRAHLIVEFYTIDEWKEIEQLAVTAGDSSSTKIARELLALAHRNQLDVGALLAQGNQRRIDGDDINSALEQLNEYVGENGRFTALVKMTHLFLPRDELRGFEVVDTPGMNDPVQSRTQKTRDYMCNCDVVFFLSRGSQFLDQSDMDLLGQQLPGKGVKRMVLVAGQFDSVINDDGYERKSLAETEVNVKARLSKGADEKIRALANQRERMGNPEAAGLLQSLRRPIFASTFAFGFASWPEERWGRSMRHVHDELQEIARERWGNYQFTREDWLRIGNFESLRAAYEAARRDRLLILKQQKSSLIPAARQQFAERVSNLIEAVDGRLTTLQSGDLATLKKQQEVCESRIQAINGRLRKCIDDTITGARAEGDKLMRQIRSDSQRFNELKTREGTETTRSSYEISTSVWYKPWTWGDTETRYRTMTERYQYLSAADAVEQVRNYADECAEEIQVTFNRLLRPDKLKADLRKTLLDAIDTHSADFNPHQFKSIINHALDRLAIPNLSLEKSDHSESISRFFIGEVKDKDQANKLRDALLNSLNNIFDDLGSSFSIASDCLYSELESLRDSLSEGLTADVKVEIDHLREDFTRKEEQVSHYKSLIQRLRASLRKS